MEYLGDKLSVAQSQVSGWVGNVRRSLHGAFGLLSGSVERGGRGGDDGAGDFKRTNSLRSLASRSRESIRRFSLRSQQRLSLRRRTAPNTPTAVQQSGGEDAVAPETPLRDTDSQYGTWETGLRSDDSLTPATPSSDSTLSPSPRKPTPPHTPGDLLDSVDHFLSPTSPANQTLSFPDAPPSLLDTSALRSRAQLGKKRAPRTRPSRAARQSAALSEAEGADWLYRDSTEAKAEPKDDGSDSEEPVRGADGGGGGGVAASQPQRVALFPGMDPSALKAQLKKRGDGDAQTDGLAHSPSLLSRSPKSPFLPRAARVLPPAGGKENGEENSPQWLKELKSKKRLSQYDADS